MEWNLANCSSLFDILKFATCVIDEIILLNPFKDYYAEKKKKQRVDVKAELPLPSTE